MLFSLGEGKMACRDVLRASAPINLEHFFSLFLIDQKLMIVKNRNGKNIEKKGKDTRKKKS